MLQIHVMQVSLERRERRRAPRRLWWLRARPERRLRAADARGGGLGAVRRALRRGVESPETRCPPAEPGLRSSVGLDEAEEPL